METLRHQSRAVKLTFTGGHISLAVAIEGPNVVLGLYKCNYSLTRGKELCLWGMNKNDHVRTHEKVAIYKRRGERP